MLHLNKLFEQIEARGGDRFHTVASSSFFATSSSSSSLSSSSSSSSLSVAAAAPSYASTSSSNLILTRTQTQPPASASRAPLSLQRQRSSQSLASTFASTTESTSSSSSSSSSSYFPPSRHGHLQTVNNSKKTAKDAASYNKLIMPHLSHLRPGRLKSVSRGKGGYLWQVVRSSILALSSPSSSSPSSPANDIDAMGADLALEQQQQQQQLGVWQQGGLELVHVQIGGSSSPPFFSSTTNTNTLSSAESLPLLKTNS